jgi:hypothetical protein
MEPQSSVVAEQPVPSAEEICQLLVNDLADGLDHPDLWPAIPQFLDQFPGLPAVIAARLMGLESPRDYATLSLLFAMARAHLDSLDGALADMEALALQHSSTPLIQGGLFYLQSLHDPDNPRYRLQERFCTKPFEQMDVLEASTHLCCASYLPASVGKLSEELWPEVWNSQTAQNIRASIHDGSYRYCNKTACPGIQAPHLPVKAELAQTAEWGAIIADQTVELEAGPKIVNLAYDRTCNLSCPSCRTEVFAADTAMRAQFDDMQQRNILPLLADATFVAITGSGDPFASKNFRRLMEQLTPDAYPDMRFQVMTNGMLFNRREWDRFPALHNRVYRLKVSVDAATGPTHERLRRGARWPVMLENMKFCGELQAEGVVDFFELVFTVQAENFREMGDAVDLAREVGARGIHFSRMTNWGTFSDEEYRQKAVVMTTHPEHAAFLDALHDPRLHTPMVTMGDLKPFLQADRLSQAQPDAA